MSRLRVLVVEDSLTVRKRLVEVLSADSGIEVVGEAENGQEGIELCQKLRPDVISTDMMMPVMTGLAMTEYIMAYCPTPILIVSASINRGEAVKTMDALAAGAIDVLDKPSANEGDEGWDERLRATLRIVARIRVITHPRAKLERRAAPVATGTPSATLSAAPLELCAIGASTGGPQAFMTILPALQDDFTLPILLVSHIDRRFDEQYAYWLDGLSARRVVRVTDGLPLPRPGDARVFVAPADRHLVLERGLLRLTTERERHSCRPSVDVLFESLAREMGNRTLACLLTGMGVDGASGLRAIRLTGGMTVAQDEATSLVYGMPRAAAELGAARHVAGLGDVAPLLTRLASGAV